MWPHRREGVHGRCSNRGVRLQRGSQESLVAHARVRRFLACHWRLPDLLAEGDDHGYHDGCRHLHDCYGRNPVPCCRIRQRGRRAVVDDISGIAGIVLGVVVIKNPEATIGVIVLVVAMYWLISGLVDLARGLTDSSLPDRTVRIVFGLMSTIFGIVILTWPGVTVGVFAVVSGCTGRSMGFLRLSPHSRSRARSQTLSPAPQRQAGRRTPQLRWLAHPCDTTWLSRVLR